MRRKGMPPVKFGKSQTIKDRNTGKSTIKHEYMKNQSTSDLIEKYNNSNTTGRLKQKVKNELVRRMGRGGKKIEFVPKPVAL
jgi:hypothetical protein